MPLMQPSARSARPPICEPLLTSLAGGGFLLARPAGGEPEIFDFFVQTPRQKRPAGGLDFAPVLVDFGPAQQEFHVGLGAAAVPGDCGRDLRGSRGAGESAAAPRSWRRPLSWRVVAWCRRLTRSTSPRFSCRSWSARRRRWHWCRHRTRRACRRRRVSGLRMRNRQTCWRSWPGGRVPAFTRGAPGQRLVRDCRARGGLLTLRDLDVLPGDPPAPDTHAPVTAPSSGSMRRPRPVAAWWPLRWACWNRWRSTAQDWGSERSILAVLGAMDAANRLRAATLHTNPRRGACRTLAQRGAAWRPGGRRRCRKTCSVAAPRTSAWWTSRAIWPA